MQRRDYSRPEIVRVRLNPEQAVLSQCSVAAASVQNADPSGFCKGGRMDCRLNRGRGGSDSAAAS